jgi:hypothetical protein
LASLPLRTRLADALPLSRSGPCLALWLAACILGPVLALGLLGSLPAQWGALRHFPLSDARLTTGLAAAAVLALGFWLARRREPLPPWPFVLATTAIALGLRLAYTGAVETVWTNDFLLYWDTAKQQVASGNYAVTSLYNERTLPILVPLILLFGPDQQHVILANVAMLTLMQLAGYDLLRRMHSHQAAQAFSVAFMAAPIPLFALTIPSHDLWAMGYCAGALWLCAVVLTHRGRRTTRVAVAVAGALALVCLMMEVQRGIGLLLAAAMLLAALMGWLAQRGEPSAGRRPVPTLLLVCAAALAAQWPLGALLGKLDLRAADEPGHRIHMAAYYASNGTSLGNGTWGWMDGFRQEFTEPLRTDDPQRLEQLSRSLVLSDWAEQPLKRLDNVADRLAGLFVLDDSNFWYFSDADPALAKPLGWLRLYSLFVSLGFTLALGAGLVRLLLGGLPSVPTLAGLVLTSVVALALCSFSENQPRYLMLLWFTGLLFLAETVGRRPAPTPPSLRLGAAMAVAVALGWLGLVATLLLPARALYGPEDGRILGDWTRVSTGTDTGALPITADPNPYVHVTDPGELAVALVPNEPGVQQSLCLPENGRDDFAFFVRAKSPQPGDALVVRFGDGAPHRFELAGAEGKTLDLRIPDLGAGGTCGSVSMALESPSPEPTTGAEVFFPRLEAEPQDEVP